MQIYFPCIFFDLVKKKILKKKNFVRYNNVCVFCGLFIFRRAKKKEDENDSKIIYVYYGVHRRNAERKILDEPKLKERKDKTTNDFFFSRGTAGIQTKYCNRKKARSQ